MTKCWNCRRPEEGQLFCSSCKSLQPPPVDYFQFFGLPEKLTIDPHQLQSRFYQLSRLLHPDRYSRKPALEQAYSLEATSVLNDGYRTLKDPIPRAEYVLKRHDFDIGEQRSQDVPPELLEEVFELNMTLEELRAGDGSVRPQLEQERRRFQELLAEVDRDLVQLFAQYDAGGGLPALTSIRGLLNRRRYITNLIREVEKELG